MDRIKKLLDRLGCKKSPLRIDTGRTVASLQGTVVVVALLGALAVGWAFISTERERLADALSTSGWRATHLLAHSLALSCGQAPDKVELPDAYAIKQIIRHAAISNDKMFRGVLVTDPQGKELAGKWPAQCRGGQAPQVPDDAEVISEKVGSRHRVFSLPATGERVHEFRSNVDSPERTVAAVTTWYAMPGTWSLLRGALAYSRLPLGLLAVVLVVGNYLVSKWLHPIQQLRTRSREVSQSEKWETLEFTGKGDAAEIAKSWDAMVARFDGLYDELGGINRKLEVSNKVIAFEQRRTESIIDALSLGVIVLDAHNNVCLLNREAEALLKVKRADVMGKGTAELTDHADMTAFLADCRCGTNKHSRRTTELKFELQDGPDRTVKVVTTPLKTGSDETTGTLVAISDITQLKLEQQARQDFVASVSHELRAPLAAIKGYVEMLIDDEANSPELRREFFNTINSECDRLARLVDNMIDISKIEIGGMVLNRSLVKTRRLLQDAASSVAAQAKAKDITLQARIPEDIPDIDADKEMFRVAVMNLLGNALKYTNPGGSIVLIGERVGNELRINVADTGWGIPQEEQSKIFQKFYRGKQAASYKVTGNGLGLALTREIATLHGGGISVESEVGKGSKFTITLPVS